VAAALAALSALFITKPATADCVLNARSKTSFVVLDIHTIFLKGGLGGAILLKSFGFFYPGSNVTVLKDTFCDFEDGVLYVDGELFDAREVKQVN
jgi:hypothetical protein